LRGAGERTVIDSIDYGMVLVAVSRLAPYVVLRQAHVPPPVVSPEVAGVTGGVLLRMHERWGKTKGHERYRHSARDWREVNNGTCMAITLAQSRSRCIEAFYFFPVIDPGEWLRFLYCSHAPTGMR
jgi:hypothetical protein